MTSMKKLLCVFAASSLMVGTAQAQDAEKAAETSAASPETAPDADASATNAEKVLEQDLDLIWGEKRKIQVVEPRLYHKSERFELTAFAASIPNDDFMIYFPLGLRAGYHISEAFTVELSYAYALQSQTDLAKFLEGNGIDLKRAEVQEKIEMYAGAAMLWAPIYGKISLLGQKLTHFETYVGLGLGVVFSETTESTNPEPQAQRKPAANTIFGFRWFIDDTFNIHTEYRHFFFEKHEGGVSIPAEFSLGLGVIL